MTEADARPGDEDVVALRIVRGNPSDEELAATHAVLAAAIAEQDALGAERLVTPVDLWQRSARAPRYTLPAGPGRWVESRGARGC